VTAELRTTSDALSTVTAGGVTVDDGVVSAVPSTPATSPRATAAGIHHEARLRWRGDVVEAMRSLFLYIVSANAAQYAGAVLRDVPNLLTVLRLFAVPVMVLCLVWDDGHETSLRWIACAVFVGAAVTDWLDGFLARRWGAVSAFGKLADPLADKALVLGALATLAYNGEVPWWPLIVIAVREVAVTLGRLAVAKDVVIAASLGGKAKTALQVLALFMLMLPVDSAWVDTVGWWVLVASVAVAVVTGVDYAWRIWRVARAHAGQATTPVDGTRDDEPASAERGGNGA